MPVDLLDRLIIVRTLPYSAEEIAQVIVIRAQTEKLVITDEGVEALAEIGVNTSLRYVMQLLTPAMILARVADRTEMCKGDIEAVDNLFYDAKSSAKLLAANADKYIS